jgi:hypothetical protein
MKLLHSKIDILVHNSKFFVENNPWVTKYIEIKIIDELSHAEFAYLNDNQYSSSKKDMISNMDKIDVCMKNSASNPV